MRRPGTASSAAVSALAALLLGGGPVLADPPDAARRAALTNLLLQDCGSCHGLTLKGGLGPALLPARLAQRDDADLVGAILDGVPGTPMPPWRPELTEDEAAWLVRLMKRGVNE